MNEKMKTEWKKVKFGEICSFKTGKLNSNAATQNGQYPFFTCSQETFKTDTYSFDTEAIILGGNNANGIYPIKYFKGKFDAYQRTYVIKALDEMQINNRFLFYNLKLRLNLLQSLSTGVATKFLTLTILKDLEVLTPHLPIQCKIASILSAYDDLIENNTRRIKILEEMAQAICKEWFVNFRFPGHEKVKMVDISVETHGNASLQNKIPEGWEVKSVRDLVKRLKAGNTYTQKDVLSFGNVPVVDQSRDEILGFHNNEPTHYASSTNPIIIFGDHTCKMQIIVEPFSLGPNVIPFISNENSTIYFLFFTIRNLVETREYKRHWNELIVKKVVLPEKRLQILFSDTVRPMTEDIGLLRKKNLNLQRTRDLLLPKLISGGIDVEGIEVW